MRTPGEAWVVKFEDVLCIDTAGQGIARIDPIMNPNAEEDADFLALAWNCHDELVEALDALRAYAIPGMNWTDEVGQALLDLADKALAKAKPQEGDHG